MAGFESTSQRSFTDAEVGYLDVRDKDGLCESRNLGST